MSCIAGLGAPGAYAHVLVQVAHIRKAALLCFWIQRDRQLKEPCGKNVHKVFVINSQCQSTSVGI